MEIVTLQAHFDGKHILLNQPYELEPDAKLIVSVINPDDAGAEDLTQFSMANLELACADDEREYPIASVVEKNRD